MYSKCLRTGTMDFFVTMQSGAPCFISFDVKASSTLTKVGGAEKEEVQAEGVSSPHSSPQAPMGRFSTDVHSCQRRSLKGKGGRKAQWDPSKLSARRLITLQESQVIRMPPTDQ